MNRIKMRHFVLTGSILTMGLQSLAAAPSCHLIYGTVSPRPAPRMLESSVEIETSAELIHKFMTTTDGTLRPLVLEAGADAIPENILKDIKESFPDMDPLDMDWDLLTSQEKQQLIMRSAQARGHQFFRNRTIPGLKYREQIQITFSKTSRFMGKDFRPGTYTFNSKDIFGSTAIEFMGPGRITENLGIEIHLRSRLGADENYKSSRSLQTATVGRIAGVHQHVVARLPIKRMSEDPEKMAFTLTEFIRRELIKAQFARLRDGQPVEVNKDINGNGNMPLTVRRDFTTLYAHFLTLGKNLATAVQNIQETRASNEARTNSLWNRLLQTSAARRIGLKPLSLKEIQTQINGTTFSRKMGLIGVRSYDVYDGSRWQWGIENRDLTPHRDVDEQLARLKKAQSRMISQDYQIDYSTFETWRSQGILSEKMDSLYFPDQNSFQNPMENLTANFPYIEALKDPALADAVKIACNNNLHNTGLNILFHDWAADPIVNGDANFIQQIEAARDIAIKRLARGESSNTVMQYFVKKSGLDYHMTNL